MNERELLPYSNRESQLCDGFVVVICRDEEEGGGEASSSFNSKSLIRFSCPP
jgi:hypothetical protein